MKKFARDIILHICTKTHNHMMYDSWDTEWDRQNFLSLWTAFCPFTPLTTPKNKILKNWKKLYCSLDMAHNGCNCYFSFWANFCPFTSLTAQKIKIKKKWKNPLEISSFYNSVPKIMIIYYTIPEICCVTDVIIFHFGLCFALLPL